MQLEDMGDYQGEISSPLLRKYSKKHRQNAQVISNFAENSSMSYHSKNMSHLNKINNEINIDDDDNEFEKLP